MPIKTFRAFIAAVAATAAGFGSAALAQPVPLNYDALASLEEPLATEIGDVTFVLSGLLDAPVVFDLGDGDDDSEALFIGNFQVSAETQLPNRWNVGAAYFGQYVSDPGAVFGVGGGDRYDDNYAVYAAGAWGAVAAGEVNGMVREETRRRRGVGSAILFYDAPYGGFAEEGAGYAGRFGPMRFSGVVDDDSNFDLGASWSRPIGNKDFRFTGRYTDSEFVSADGAATYDSNAVGGVGEFVFGSGIYDIGVGVERLDSAASDVERWFASSGVRWKRGAVSLSLEGHYGEVESQSETSAAAGVAYDIARGLSANFGLNHADARIVVDGVTLKNDDVTQAIVSLRYGY